MPRRIKKFGGQKATHPIKSKRQLDEVMRYLNLQIEHAKSEVKKKTSL